MLLIGYGNPGRCDDGLGPAFAARMAACNIPGLDVSTDYQLSVDHALRIANVSQVVFVDAMMNSDAPFRFSRAKASASCDLSSHSLSPSSVLALAATLYDAKPKAYVLGIAGEEFGEVREKLSAAAKANLDLAEVFFLDWLRGVKPAEALRGYVDA